MSYEGYSQLLCAKGHYWTEDCLSTGFELKDNICPTCQAPAIWENMVDLTNGSYDDQGNRIDGLVELKVSSRKICDKCNSCLETTFHIPENHS